MMWLVSGAYTGTPESYAVFIHPILSWTFSKLYTFAPIVPWYPLTWFLVILLSFIALILSLNHSKIGLNEKNILALFCLCLFLHFALFLQFTIVAGIAGFSGVFLLHGFNLNKTISITLLSLILMTLSILIRWESFVLISLGFGFYLLIFNSLNDILKSLKWFLLPCLLLVLLLGTKTLWEKQSEYSDFIQYNKARAAVSDHPISYQLALENKLEADSKWFFFSQWMMEDEGFSLIELEERKTELDAKLYSRNQIQNSLSRLVLVMRTEAFKSTFSVILIVLFLYGFKGSKKSLIFLVSWILFFIVFNHFFILNGRVIILFFLPFLFPLVFEPKQTFKNKKTSLTLATLIVLFFSFHLLNFFSETRARKTMREEFLSLTEKLPEGSLIILEGYKENFLGINYTLDKPVPLLSLGWISQSPFQQKKLQNLNLQHLSDADEYYLLEVDINEEFFFPAYMKYLGRNYELESRLEKANFILFHYSVNH